MAIIGESGSVLEMGAVPGSRRREFSEVQRQLISFAVGLLSECATFGLIGEGRVSEMISFTAYSSCYLILTSRFFLRSRAEDVYARMMRSRSRRRDWVMRRLPVIMAFVSGYYSVYSVVSLSPWNGSADHAASVEHLPIWALTLVSGLSVAAGWMMSQIAFAHHYARRYYRDGAGMEFPGSADPTYLDFVYYALTVGMTFGTPDVELTETSIRLTVLGHQLYSFLFNTVIVALLVTFLTSMS